MWTSYCEKLRFYAELFSHLKVAFFLLPVGEKKELPLSSEF